MILYTGAMDSILVISEEAALAKTLRHELPGVAVEEAHPKEAVTRLKQAGSGLIVMDEGANPPADTGSENIIRITRPVRLSELLYTIRVRLQGKSAREREEPVLAAGYRFYRAERLVRMDDGNGSILLTEKETELLQCLVAARGHTVARDVLLKEVWGYSDDIATHTLETHIYRLRGKLRQASDALDILSSEEGGYQLKSA